MFLNINNIMFVDSSSSIIISILRKDIEKNKISNKLINAFNLYLSAEYEKSIEILTNYIQ